MEKVDWFYVYSQRYYPFHFCLQEKIPSSVFQAKGIFIDQSVFDEHLYKHEGEHFFSRITIKIETILRLIRERRAEMNPTPFLFTDCDIVVRPYAENHLYGYSKLEGMDILFQQEHVTGPTVNPGAMMIWPSETTERFFQTVMDDMVAAPTMEMASINKIIPFFNIKWGFFHTNHVCSSITANPINIFTFSIYHILCKNGSREIDIGDKMFESGTNGQVMDKYIQMTIEKYGQIFM
jgi:hypothetical protein